MVVEQDSDFDEDPHRPQGPTSAVGRALRESRLRAGYSLPDVASMLRIRLVYLQAIEEGRFQDLPGVVYTIGFIRTYGEFLDLDVDLLIERLRQEVSEANRRTELNFPEPPPDARVPGGAIVVIGLLLAIVAYGGWYYLSSNQMSVADLFDRGAAEEQVADAAGSGPAVAPPATTSERPVVGRVRDRAVEAAAGLPVDLEAQPMMGAANAAEPWPDLPRSPTSGFAAMPPSVMPEPQVAETAAIEEAPVVAEPAAPLPVIDDSLQVAAVPEPRRDVVISARAMSWVQVRDGAGRLVMTRVLQPGDSYEVPRTEGLVLDTGNAGGLVITLGGEDLPSVGRSGEVVRNISLDVEALRTALGTATR